MQLTGIGHKLLSLLVLRNPKSLSTFDPVSNPNIRMFGLRLRRMEIGRWCFTTESKIPIYKITNKLVMLF